MNDRSSLANPFTRDLAVGASQNIFAGELQSGAFLMNVTTHENGGDIVNNSKWLLL